MRIFLCMNTNLGWRILGERIEAALNRLEGGAQHTFKPFTLDGMLRNFTWSADYSVGEKRRLALLEPHHSYYFATHSFRKQAYGYDAVLAATGALAGAFIRDKRSPPVFQMIDATRKQFSSEFGIANVSRRAISVDQDACSRVMHTFCLSHWAKNSLVNDYGIEEKKVTVIPPMGPKVGHLQTMPQLKHSSGRLQLIFIGGDFVRKGGNSLIEWQREVLHQRVDLHVVTDDKYRDASVPSTFWYGQLDNDTILSSLLPKMHLLCHPTTRDCSAIVVTEAASLGVPAITTNIGGIPDLVEDGLTGFLFEPQDRESFISKILDLSTDRAQLQRLQSNAKRKSLLEFGPDILLEKILNTVEKCLRAN